MRRRLDDAEQHLDLVRLAVFESRHDVTWQGLAVDDQGFYASGNVLGIFHAHPVRGAAKHARELEAVPSLGNAGIDLEPRVARAHAQNVFGGRLVAPARGAGQPAVAADTELRMLVAQDVLGVDVRLELVLFHHLVLRRRIDLHVVLKRAVAVTDQRLGDHHPWVTVQENAAVFLGARRVSGDAALAGIVAVEAGRGELDAVFGVEVALDRVERFVGALTGGKAGNDRPALAVRPDFALLVVVRADGAAVVVEVADVPFAVPGVLIHARAHL